MGNATINGVTDPGLGLIGNGNDGLATVVDGEVEEEFGHVASPKHLMYGGEPGGALLRAEIWGEYAIRCAFPP